MGSRNSSGNGVPEGGRGHGAVAGPDERTETAPVDEAPGGPFPSWRAVYLAVLVYGFLMILFLLVLTRILDPGAGAP